MNQERKLQIRSRNILRRQTCHEMAAFTRKFITEASGTMIAEKPVALIFRTQLLPYSETFIRNQAEAMQRYLPYYVGIRDVHGLDLPEDACWIANRGGLAGFWREARWALQGVSRECTTHLARLKPKLLHAHFGPDGAAALPIAAALALPLLVTYHGYDATHDDASLGRSRLGRRYLRERPGMAEKVEQFFAVSKFIKSRMVNQGFPEEKILVHYIGIDTTWFCRPERRPGTVKVLFTGRLTEKKGCSYLIRAMALVQKKMPEVELIVIGDGDQRARLERQAEGSLTKFTFLGRQPPVAVRSWMQTSTLFSVPSVTAADGDSEGFGMVFAEAQACGLPVVSFASGGIPEAVIHGETGMLAPERDFHRLADYLLILLQQADLRNEFSHAGRRRAVRMFDLEQQTAILEDIYTEVCIRVAARKPACDAAPAVLLDELESDRAAAGDTLVEERKTLECEAGT